MSLEVNVSNAIPCSCNLEDLVEAWHSSETCLKTHNLRNVLVYITFMPIFSILMPEEINPNWMDTITPTQSKLVSTQLCIVLLLLKPREGSRRSCTHNLVGWWLRLGLDEIISAIIVSHTVWNHTLSGCFSLLLDRVCCDIRDTCLDFPRDQLIVTITTSS